MSNISIKLTLAGVALASMASIASAFPPFKDKEKVPACTFCHQQPSGGKRNYRGMFYKRNALSFAKFDDKAEAEKAGVEVGPFPDAKPTSWTAPDKPEPEATPTPAPRPKVNIPVLKAKAAEWYAKYKKDPKANAKPYSQALAELGHGQMLDQSVPPVKRYPMALGTLRSALKVDKTNKLALEDLAMIENAYKSMGKPVPK